MKSMGSVKSCPFLFLKSRNENKKKFLFMELNIEKSYVFKKFR